MFFDKIKSLFNRNVEDITDIVLPSWKVERYNHARDTAAINYISPKQIDEVINNNQDIDFLKEEIKEQMNYPDLNYLKHRLMPEIKDDLVRKNINPLNIVRAVAIGDIIGSRFEFTDYDYDSIKERILPPKNGFFTDDTVLSYATMKAVVDNPINPDFRQAYINFYTKFPMAGYGSSFVNWALNGKLFYMEGMNDTEIDNTKGYHSMANGCAMRLAFIPAYYDDIDDVINNTIKSCMTTHNHVEGVKGSIILSVCIWMALHHYSKDEIYQYCKKHYLYTEKEREELIYKWCQYDMDQPLSEIDNGMSQETLFTNYAVPFAIKCFYLTDNYDSCMREILSHYGDNDTLCAIAAGLCMAFYETTGYDVNTVLKEKEVYKVEEELT